MLAWIRHTGEGVEVSYQNTQGNTQPMTRTTNDVWFMSLHWIDRNLFPDDLPISRFNSLEDKGSFSSPFNVGVLIKALVLRPDQCYRRVPCGFTAHLDIVSPPNCGDFVVLNDLRWCWEWQSIRNSFIWILHEFVFIRFYTSCANNSRECVRNI